MKGLTELEHKFWFGSEPNEPNVFIFLQINVFCLTITEPRTRIKKMRTEPDPDHDHGLVLGSDWENA